MAFAAFFTTGCGVFLGNLLRYLLGGLITGVITTRFTPLQTLSPQVRLFVTTGFRGDLTTSSTFFAETVMPLRREYVCALRSASVS